MVARSIRAPAFGLGDSLHDQADEPILLCIHERAGDSFVCRRSEVGRREERIDHLLDLIVRFGPILL
jgi:hypothetical protein